jgi:hypothetical protein
MYSGATAIAHFETRSPDGCLAIVTDVFAVNGQLTTTPAGHAAGSAAEVYAGAIDFCHAASVPFSVYGESDLSPGQFVVDTTLASATLIAAIPVVDRVTGGTFVVDVNVSWAAVVSPQVTRSVTTHFVPDGTIDINRSSGTYRTADAKGTVLLGSMNVTPDPAVQYATSIQAVKNGEHTLTR